MHQVDRAQALVQGLSFPPTLIEIHPTDACSHSCIFCIAKDDRAKGATLSWMELETMLRDLAQMGVDSVLFSGGGDPLQYFHIVDALLEAKRLGLRVNLITNGSAMNAAVRHAIAQSCTEVRISLDAATAETHRKLHRPEGSDDDFETILANCLRLLQEIDRRNTRVGFSFIAYPINISEVKAFVDLADALGVAFIDLKYNFHAPEEINQRLRRAAEEIVQNHSAITAGRLELTIDRLIPRQGLPRLVASAELWPQLDFYAAVEANGDVYPCCHLIGERDYIEGNALRQTFSELWYSTDWKNWKTKVLSSGVRCPVCVRKKNNQRMARLYKKLGRT